MLKRLLNFFYQFRLYLANTSWILGGRISQLLIGLIVSIILARYLGPEKLGVLAYATSLTAMFATAGHMGLSGLIVREIVKKPGTRNEVLGSATALKGTGFTLGFFIIVIIALITEGIGSIKFWVVIIISSSLLFKSSEIFSFWFEAHVQAKYSTIATGISSILSGAIKLILVAGRAKLLFFAGVNLFQEAITAILLFYFYKKTSDLPVRFWFTSFRKVKELLGQGWVIFLGAIFANIYLKIDQLMLKWMIGAEEVGIYSVASTLSETWYFVPVAIMTSFFPKLIELHKSNPKTFNIRLQQIFDLLFILALLVVILVTLLAEPVINILYGSGYKAAGPILVVHIWASIFISMRAAFSKWILIENALVFSLITQGFGAVINVALNTLLIPKYAGLGAAFATLVSYAAASYFSLFFFQKSRPIFWMMSLSLISPVRYSYLMLKRKNAFGI